MTALIAALVLAPPAPIVAPTAAVPVAVPSAQALIADASAKAASAGKNVLVHFGASWCPWCRKFDALLNDRALRPAWVRSYVPVEIIVRERKPELKPRENAGGVELLRALRGSDATDIPYFAILDPQGKKLADSMYTKKGETIPNNAGYPSAPEEIALLLDVVDRTGKFRPGERTVLAAELRKKG